MTVKHNALPRPVRSVFDDALSTPGVRTVEGGLGIDPDGRHHIRIRTDRVAIYAVHTADPDDYPGQWSIRAEVDGQPVPALHGWPSAHALLADADAFIAERITPTGAYVERATPEACPTWEPADGTLTGAEVTARMDALRKAGSSRIHHEPGSITLVQEWPPACTEHEYHSWTYTPSEGTTEGIEP